MNSNEQSTVYVGNPLGQAVEELVQNSVDSGAKSVKIVVDPICLKICVSDDGKGGTDYCIKRWIALHI